jgi:hypothetical protein
VSKPWKPNKPTVELQPAARPSRIRREPPPPDNKLESLAGKVDWGSREWEIRLALAGVIAFALALSVLAVAVGSYAGWSPSQYSVKLNAAE